MSNPQPIVQSQASCPKRGPGFWLLKLNSQSLPGWRVNLEGLHRSDPTLATCLLYCCPWSQTGPVGGACLQGEASWSALSRQLALLFPPGRAYSLDRLATRLPAPAIIGRREAGSSELHPGKCSPMFSPGGRSSEETRPVHPVWAMSPQRLRPPLPFGWTDRTPQRVTSFIRTCTVLWPCSREPCLAVLVASVCCRVRTRTLHRGCAGPRVRDGDDQAGC